MSLGELIDEKSEDDADDDTDDWLSEAENLMDFSRVKYQKDKLHKPELCPSCGTDNTEEGHYDRRCLNSKCDTLTYFPSTYKLTTGL